MPDITRDDWRFLPNDAVDAEKNQNTAQQWGADQDVKIAQRWGDVQPAPPLASSVPTRDSGAASDFNRPVPPPEVTAASAQNKFSPYDHVFKKYAGDLADNPEFLSIVAAGTLAESSWNAGNTTGDGGHSWGLFQMHDRGAGAGMGDSRLDPDAASAKMVPLYAAAYQQIKAQNPNLSGPALAARVAQAAEHSADPSGNAYAVAFQQIARNAPGLLASAGQFLGQKAADIGQGVQQAVQGLQQTPPGVSDTGQDVYGRPYTPPSGPNAGDIVQGIGNFLTEPQPWMQNVVGAQTKEMQAGLGAYSQTGKPIQPLTQPEQYTQARGIATGIAQTLAPEDIIARGAVTGAGSLQKSVETAAALLTGRQKAEGINPFEAAANLINSLRKNGWTDDRIAESFRAQGVPDGQVQQLVSQAQPEGAMGFPSRGEQLASREARDQAIQAAQKGLGVNPEEVTPPGGILRPADAADRARIQSQLDQQTAKDYPGIFGDRVTGTMKRLDAGDESALNDLQQIDKEQSVRDVNSPSFPPEGTVRRTLPNSDVTNTQVPHGPADVPPAQQWDAYGNQVTGQEQVPVHGIPAQVPGEAPVQPGGKGRRIERPPTPDLTSPPQTGDELDQLLRDKYQGGPGGEGYFTKSVTGPQAAGRIPGKTTTPGLGTGQQNLPSQTTIGEAATPPGGPVPPGGSPGVSPIPPGGAPGGLPIGVTPDHVEIAHARIDKAIDIGQFPQQNDAAHNQLDQLLQANAGKNGGAGDVARFLWNDVERNKIPWTSRLRTFRTGSMAGGATTEDKILFSPIIQAAVRGPEAALRSIITGKAGDIPKGLAGVASGFAETMGLAGQVVTQGITWPQALTGSESGFFGFRPGMDVMGKSKLERAIGTAGLGLVRTHGAISEISAGIGRNASLGIGATEAKAQQVGQEWALRAKPNGTIGRAIDDWLSGLKEINPVFDVAGQVLIPFYRVSYNAYTQGVERSPLGLAGTAVDVARSKLPSGTPPWISGPYAQNATQTNVSPLAARVTRNISGTVGLSTLGLYLASQGLITGQNPGREAGPGAPQWSIRTPAGWVPLRMAPIVTEALAQSAILHEAIRDSTFRSKTDISEFANRSASAYAKHMEDETWLRTVLGLTNAALEYGQQYTGPRYQKQQAQRDLQYQGAGLGQSVVPQYKLGSQIGSAVQPLINPQPVKPRYKV